MPNDVTDYLHSIAWGQNAALFGRGFTGRQLEQSLASRAGSGSGSVDVLANDAPWNEQPFNSIPFYPKTSISLPAVGSPDTLVTRLIVPDGHDGVIRQISCNFAGGSLAPGSGNIVWRILRNNIPVTNFDNMIAEYGTIDQPVEISGIRIASNDVVDFVVNHVANASLNGLVICAFEGYFYPKVGNFIP